MRLFGKRHEGATYLKTQFLQKNVFSSLPDRFESMKALIVSNASLENTECDLFYYPSFVSSQTS